MPISRIFQSIPLNVNTSIQLDAAATHHISRVLRAKIGDELIIFNGEGMEYASIITLIDKKSVTVQINEEIKQERESQLDLYLAQGISRGEKMDYTIQKAVELGVKKIIPLLTERCNVKLDNERREKRLQHWSSIIISACEQSGRNHVPDILLPQTLEHFLEHIEADVKLVLAPHADKKLKDISFSNHSRVVLLIGPEGGLSDREIELSMRKDFLPLNLGPRVLRTETAAVAAMAVLQFFKGDLN